MNIAVIVSMEGSLQDVLTRAEYAIRSAKKLMKSPLAGIAVYGPHLGFSEGHLASLQYRLTNLEESDRATLWNRAPDDVLRMGAAYGKTHR